VHELLIHVTTGLAVPDGRDDEDLGRNFRKIAATILDRFITPHREELARVFEQVKHKASVVIERELANAFTELRRPVGADQSGDWRRLFAFGKSRKPAPKLAETVAERDQRILSQWSKKSQSSEDRLERGLFRSFI
jgi:hypothetical protein